MSVLLRGTNKLFPADGTRRFLAFVESLDVDLQIAVRAVRPFAQMTLMTHLLVDSRDVFPQHRARIKYFVAKDAFELSFDVFDESVIAEMVFTRENPAAILAFELLLVFHAFFAVTIAEMFFQLGDADELTADFARAFFLPVILGAIIAIFVVPVLRVGQRFRR